MAKLSPVKRFSIEDFPSQSDWIGTLFFPLNLFLTNIYSALNNDITLGENIRSQVTTLKVKGSSPSTNFPYKFSPNLPLGVSVINTVQTNTPAVSLTGAVGATFTFSKGVVTVTVQGLNTAGEYNCTFVVWGG